MSCSRMSLSSSDGCGLSLRNSLTRATHVAWAALDLVFCFGVVSAEYFAVHQGDDCCLMSPSCCPALADHFLCDFQLSVMDNHEAHCAHADGVRGAHSDFPQVQDGRPSCSLHRRDSMSGLPLYRIVQGSMADYRCDVPRSLRSLTLWLGFSGKLFRHFIQGHQVSHAKGASRVGGQTTVSRRWWLAILPGETTKGPTCVKILHVFHPIVSTCTGWFVLLGVVSGDVGKTRSPSCAPRTPKLAHFSSVNTSSTHENFSADFYSSMTRRFFELTADHSPGDFGAPFSASELSRALNFCHDSTPGQDGLAYGAFQSDLPWWRASLLLFFNLMLEWNVVPSA